jgi:hypothetical protein
MKEPETDAEFEAAIEAAGYKFLDLGNGFAVRNVELDGTTRLEADEMSDALFEAWNMVKPDES